MLKMLKLFAWIVFSVLVLLAADQLLVRVPLGLPGATQAQTFYVDFRGRLLDLIGVSPGESGAGKSIEEVIEATTQAPTLKKSAPQRYLYVDESGELQFADSLSLVPAKYREAAQPLAD
jgi:hypothetical protein